MFLDEFIIQSYKSEDITIFKIKCKLYMWTVCRSAKLGHEKEARRLKLVKKLCLIVKLVQEYQGLVLLSARPDVHTITKCKL